MCKKRHDRLTTLDLYNNYITRQPQDKFSGNWQSHAEYNLNIPFYFSGKSLGSFVCFYQLKSGVSVTLFGQLQLIPPTDGCLFQQAGSVWREELSCTETWPSWGRMNLKFKLRNSWYLTYNIELRINPTLQTVQILCSQCLFDIDESLTWTAQKCNNWNIEKVLLTNQKNDCDPCIEDSCPLAIRNVINWNEIKAWNRAIKLFFCVGGVSRELLTPFDRVILLHPS